MYKENPVYLKGGGQYRHLIKIKADGNNKETVLAVSGEGFELGDLVTGL